MDWSAVFSVTVLHGYIPQILLAEALYTLRLPRRSRFWLRLCIGLPVCAFLAVVIPNIVAQFTAGLFSIIIFLQFNSIHKVHISCNCIHSIIICNIY